MTTLYLAAGFDDDPNFTLLVRSTDGVNWGRIDTTSIGSVSILGFATDNAQSIIVGICDSGDIIYSLDLGLTWALAVSPFNNNISNPTTPIAYGNGLFMVSGLISGTATIATSSDGINWIAQAIDAGGGLLQIYGIAYGNGTWIIGGHTNGGNAIQYSLDDGINWTPTPSGFDDTAFNPFTPEINAITYGDGKFVAIGDVLDGSSRTSLVQISSDGITWTTSVTHLNDGGRGEGDGIAFGNGLFVVGGLNGLGDAAIESSPDAISGNWTVQTDFGAAPDLIYQVAFGGGLFMVAGQTGSPEVVKLKTSPDGINWTTPSIPTTGSGLLSSAFGLASSPPPIPTEPSRLVRDPWDVDEWGRFYPGAGYHIIT